MELKSGGDMGNQGCAERPSRLLHPPCHLTRDQHANSPPKTVIFAYIYIYIYIYIYTHLSHYILSSSQPKKLIIIFIMNQFCSQVTGTWAMKCNEFEAFHDFSEFSMKWRPWRGFTVSPFSHVDPSVRFRPSFGHLHLSRI